MTTTNPQETPERIWISPNRALKWTDYAFDGGVEYARVRDSAAATLEKDRDLAYADGYNDGFRHGKQSRAAVSTEECETKCEHGVLWTMGCLSCGPSDYAAAASPIALRDEVHDHTWEGSNNGSGVSYLCSDPDCRVGIDQVTE